MTANRSVEVMLPNQMAKDVMISVLEHLDTWPIKTAAAFRNIAVNGGLFAINPLLNIKKDEYANYLKRTIFNTIFEGRMIDFGFIPNEVIKNESTRSRDPFEAGELIHPYDTWLGVTSWEGGFNGYHISPHPYFPGETLVIELYGVSIPNDIDVMFLYDIVSIKVLENADHRGYRTQLSPLMMDFSQTPEQLQHRGSNSLDPLVTMLRLLADASIPINDVEAPHRLNRVRKKHGKEPIPGHTHVETRDYVAAFTARKATVRGAVLGGHHASPIAHWRRSHWRTLPTGKTVPVKASRVNWRDAEELHRMFYKIDKEIK